MNSRSIIKCFYLSIFCIALTSCAYTASQGGSHAYIIKEYSETVKEVLDNFFINNPAYIAWQTNRDGEIYNPNRCLRTGIYGYWFRVPVDNFHVLICVQLNTNGGYSESEIILKAFTYAKDFREFIRFGDTSKKERKKVLKAFEKEVLDKLGLEYYQPWLQYYPNF